MIKEMPPSITEVTKPLLDHDLVYTSHMPNIDTNTHINYSQNISGRVDELKIVSGDSPQKTYIQCIEHVRTVNGIVEEANVVTLTVGDADIMEFYEQLTKLLESKGLI